jgi:hypothetical protein
MKRFLGKAALEVHKGNLMIKFTMYIRIKHLKKEGEWGRHRICPVDGVGHDFRANTAKLVSAV